MSHVTTTKVTAPKTAQEAHMNVAPIIAVLIAAHAAALRRVLEAPDDDARALAQVDADQALNAQLSLVALELYVYNQIQAERAVQERSERE